MRIMVQTKLMNHFTYFSVELMVFTLCFVMVSGGSVSCIATDDSRSGAVAVACDNQLLVYMHSEKQSVN